jgi:phosphoribosylformimino-5-aminoimidazole carboxamide ribotide isomerase
VVARPPSTFELLPAIDLRGGRVVRLEQGAFDRERVYGDDPAATATAFAQAGAPWIHVVDLDGARTGERQNDAALARIVAALRDAGDERGQTRIQAAGGLRDADAVARVLAAGADRVVLGTAALADPRLVADAIDRHGTDRIAVALDVRDGRALGDGWTADARGRDLDEAVRTLGDVGVGTFVVTAIARDGLLGGPDLDLLRSVVDASPAAVIASGGIASIDDLLAVREIGCAGAIVGRALYDGRVSLPAALSSVAGVDQ